MKTAWVRSHAIGWIYIYFQLHVCEHSGRWEIVYYLPYLKLIS
jgi:hypothetical protein